MIVKSTTPRSKKLKPQGSIELIPRNLVKFLGEPATDYVDYKHVTGEYVFDVTVCPGNRALVKQVAIHDLNQTNRYSAESGISVKDFWNLKVPTMFTISAADVNEASILGNYLTQCMAYQGTQRTKETEPRDELSDETRDSMADAIDKPKKTRRGGKSRNDKPRKDVVSASDEL